MNIFLPLRFYTRFSLSLFIVPWNVEIQSYADLVKYFEFFSLLDSRIVVTMGTCGFIPVRLSIFQPDIGTSILLFKLLIGKWFWSLCTVLVACLKWMMVVWIVGSIQFYVSALSVFEILKYPPISVSGNKIWASCSILVIWFLVPLFPNVVDIPDNSSILLR